MSSGCRQVLGLDKEGKEVLLSSQAWHYLAPKKQDLGCLSFLKCVLPGEDGNDLAGLRLGSLQGWLCPAPAQLCPAPAQLSDPAVFVLKLSVSCSK